jgi:prolyl oligopeptidase
MVARLLELGKDVTYYENIEGGHGGAADNKQAAFLYALRYTWMWNTLTKPAPVEVQESSSSQ